MKEDLWKYSCNCQTPETVILQDERPPRVPGDDSVKEISPPLQCLLLSQPGGFNAPSPTPTLLRETALVVLRFWDSAFFHPKTTGDAGTGAELAWAGTGRGGGGLLRTVSEPRFGVLLCRWFPLALSSSLG